MAVLNTRWYISSVGYAAVAQWAATTAKTVGQMVRQLAAPTLGNERVFMCVVAGTTAASEPTWVIGQGARSPAAGSDGSITWLDVTAKPAVNGDVVNTPASSTARSTAIARGDLIKNNAGTHYFICTTAGTAGASEPTYSTTTGATTTDSGATWTCIGAVGSFTAWQAPGARITLSNSYVQADGTVYISSSHAETQAAAWSSLPAGMIQHLCVANGGAIPPGPADLTTGASVTTTGNNAISIGMSYYQGIAFNCGTGAFATALNVCTSTNTLTVLRNCALALKGTANPQFVFGNGTGAKIELINTTLGFAGGSGELVTWSGCQFVWRDTPNALSAVGGVWPSNPFRGSVGSLLIENVDLSAFNGSGYWNTNAGPLKAVFSRCKLANITPMIGLTASAGHAEIDVIDCDTAGAVYRHERWMPFEGNQVIETAVVRTLGAGSDATPYSWKVTTQFNTRWAMPFESLPIAVWNPTTGSNVTLTLEGITSATALPVNDDLWIEASYLGTAGSTLGSRASQGKATFLTTAAALPASTVAWDSLTPARANTTAYALGAFIKLASNPGRLFICTIAGTSAGSEPGGYASAVDGGSVVDGGATFRAMVRFKLQVTLTGPAPQIAGYVYARIRFAKFSALYYVDPKVALS